MEQRGCIFRFADVEVDERNFSVTKAGEVLPLEPKVFKVLQFLLHHAGRVVTKDELLEAVWNDCSVSESSLTRSVAVLRRLLGDDIHEPRYIATVPTVGYRFLCDVQVTEDGFLSAGTPGVFSESPAEPTSAVQSPPREESRRPQRKRLLVALAALVLLAGAGRLIYKKWRANDPSARPAHPHPAYVDEGLQTGATWSPDGRFVAYSSDRGGKYEIWIQQISGGDPIQITKGPDQNWQPDWSPDGKYIAYRSEEGDGGIYITPALGGVGQQRKIASLGYFPRWSPDSSRILFLPVFDFLGRTAYVVALDGSRPREILTNLHLPADHTLAFSTWHPDGKRITASILAGVYPVGNPVPAFSTEPVDGGRAIESRFPPELQKQMEALAAAPGVPEWRMDVRFAWAPSGKALFFERSFRGARNLWRMTVDPATLQPTNVERLTTSAGLDAEPSVSPDGTRLAFTSERQQIRAWAFPFDANHGRVTGPGEPVTSAGIEAWSLNLSRDGKKLGVWGVRDGKTGVWETSVPKGREQPLVATDSYHRDTPIWSPDGKRAAYDRGKMHLGEGGWVCECQIVVWSSDNRTEDPVEAVSSPYSTVYDWSPDGRSVLVTRYNSPSPSIWQVFVDPSLPGKSSAREIISDPNYELHEPHFSPDGRWIAVNALKKLNSSIYAIPAAGGPWIRITDGKQWADKPRWSPDGKTIYFLSDRRGFFNVWGVHFDPLKGRLQGEPFQVTSFETPTLMIPKNAAAVDVSLTDDRLVLPIVQTSGNIWILDNVDR